MLIEIKLSANPNYLQIDLNDVAVDRVFKTFIIPKMEVKFLQITTATPGHIEIILRDGTVYQICALVDFIGTQNVYPIEKCGVLPITSNQDLFNRLILLL